jgi:PEP-CTERM motif
MSVQKFSGGLMAAIAAIAGGSAQAAIVLSTPSYFENFDTLASTGTSSALPNGFLIAESLTNANNSYAAGTGSSNIGNTYSFGSAGSTDRALGGLRSGNLLPLFGAQFTNGFGRVINAFTISYIGELYRLGTAGGRTDRLLFEYSTNATSLTTGTWTPLSALNFTTPNTTGTVGLRDGNLAANQTALTGRISGLEVLRGQSIFVRFLDFDAIDADDGFGIDNFRVDQFALGQVPEPATWAMMIAGFGFIGGALRRRKISGKTGIA